MTRRMRRPPREMFFVYGGVPPWSLARLAAAARTAAHTARADDRPALERLAHAAEYTWLAIAHVHHDATTGEVIRAYLVTETRTLITLAPHECSVDGVVVPNVDLTGAYELVTPTTRLEMAA